MSEHDHGPRVVNCAGCGEQRWCGSGACSPPVHCHQQINYCTNPHGCGPFHYNWQTGKFVPAVPLGGYLWTETICTRA